MVNRYSGDAPCETPVAPAQGALTGMVGNPAGTCQLTQLARSLDDVQNWLQENHGWMDVYDVRRNADQIAIEHYDGLVKLHGTRVFYKDMATCKADRGES